MLMRPYSLTLVKRQSGATMIEVLIALVIFAFGVLGLAGMQARALSYSQGALLRSQAVMLTDDVADRMRADRTAALGGNYNTALTDVASGIGTTPLYNAELKDWKQRVQDLLPSGKASIALTAGAGAPTGVTITIQWDDSRGRDAAVSIVTESKL